MDLNDFIITVKKNNPKISDIDPIFLSQALEEKLIFIDDKERLFLTGDGEKLYSEVNKKYDNVLPNKFSTKITITGVFVGMYIVYIPQIVEFIRSLGTNWTFIIVVIFSYILGSSWILFILTNGLYFSKLTKDNIIKLKKIHEKWYDINIKYLSLFFIIFLSSAYMTDYLYIFFSDRPYLTTLIILILAINIILLFFYIIKNRR